MIVVANGNDESDVAGSTLLLLAATVRSFAHMPLGLSDRNTTFVQERLEWSLVDQSPEQSETEWLCVDIVGFKIISVYKSPRSRFTQTAIATFPHPSLYIGDFNCQHVNWVTTKHLLTVIAWAPGQNPTTLDCCMTQWKQSVSSLAVGTSAPTRTWPLQVSARKADCRTDVF